MTVELHYSGSLQAYVFRSSVSRAHILVVRFNERSNPRIKELLTKLEALGRMAPNGTVPIDMDVPANQAMFNELIREVKAEPAPTPVPPPVPTTLEIRYSSAQQATILYYGGTTLTLTDYECARITRLHELINHLVELGRSRFGVVTVEMTPRARQLLDEIRSALVPPTLHPVGEPVGGYYSVNHSDGSVGYYPGRRPR